MERTLLLVDDEEHILKALKRSLREEGYRILTALSGEEALEVMSGNPVQVVISDQRMPGMTGSALLGKVHEFHPETVRLILSGYADLESITDSINRGHIYKFLTKPWDNDLLLANIREAFELYENTQKTNEISRIAKSNFLANMSHEMRTPLHQILSWAELIRTKPLDQKQTEWMGRLLTAGRQMNAMIDAILRLAAIESNMTDVRDGPVHVASLLEEVLMSFQGAALDKQLQLKIEESQVPDRLLGDQVHLRTALSCYISNAVTFTPAGSVTARIRHVDDDATSVQLRFEVEDTGIGIEASALPRLFSIFEQVDNSLTRPYGGTGIGLATVKKLANLMGGDAGCESTPGKGSTFWFTVRLKKNVRAG